MSRKIPSLEALMAFEATARHQSFARAADEIALTQSAVCRQVCRLEEFLGQPLFNRVRRRLVLTDTGAAYARQVRDGLARLERDAANVMSLKAATSVLELAVVPTFSTRWLIPRLPQFAARHPDVVVNLHSRPSMFDFSEDIVDAAIHFGAPTWPDAAADQLFGEELIPVCAPALISGIRRLEPKEVGAYTLLHQPSRQSSWSRWFAQAGLSGVDAMKGPKYDLLSMLVEAAAAGIGFALAPRFFVQGELTTGRLIVPCDLTLASAQGYCFVYPENKHMSKATESFRFWLLDMATAFREQSSSQIAVTD